MPHLMRTEWNKRRQDEQEFGIARFRNEFSPQEQKAQVDELIRQAENTDSYPRFGLELYTSRNLSLGGGRIVFHCYKYGLLKRIRHVFGSFPSTPQYCIFYNE